MHFFSLFVCLLRSAKFSHLTVSYTFPDRPEKIREICLTMFDHIPCKSLSMSEILLEHQISASFVRQDSGILRAQESYVSESVFTYIIVFGVLVSFRPVSLSATLLVHRWYQQFDRK